MTSRLYVYYGTLDYFRMGGHAVLRETLFTFLGDPLFYPGAKHLVLFYF